MKIYSQITYMAPWGRTTFSPGIFSSSSAVKVACSSSRAITSLWKLSSAAASADPGAGFNIAGNAARIKLLAPRMSCVSANKPARTEARAPCLSCSANHPTRQLQCIHETTYSRSYIHATQHNTTHPGTKNSFAMPPAAMMGTLSLSDAMGVKRAPVDGNTKFPYISSAMMGKRCCTRGIHV